MFLLAFPVSLTEPAAGQLGQRGPSCQSAEHPACRLDFLCSDNARCMGDNPACGRPHPVNQRYIGNKDCQECGRLPHHGIPQHLLMQSYITEKNNICQDARTWRMLEQSPSLNKQFIAGIDTNIFFNLQLFTNKKHQLQSNKNTSETFFVSYI